jgi:predicted HicB family RNase H-like nuclease
MAKKFTLGRDVDLDKEVVRDKKGRRITEDRAVELAEEALLKVARGRPSLAGGPTHSPQVSFRAPAELRARAEERAEREGKTVSQLAREALERLLAG